LKLPVRLVSFIVSSSGLSAVYTSIATYHNHVHEKVTRGAAAAGCPDLTSAHHLNVPSVEILRVSVSTTNRGLIFLYFSKC
jgi:hypothetical protein